MRGGWPPAPREWMGWRAKFCGDCGAPLERRVPKGDSLERGVCASCSNGRERVVYENPKVVVGCIVQDARGRVLLCRRAIEPCRGLWTIPAGFMELGESAAEGAARETWEEAEARVKVEAPFMQVDIPVIGQMYMLYRASLEGSEYGSGPETLESAFVPLEDVPYNDLAFSSVSTALRFFAADVEAGSFGYHSCVIDKTPGSSPSDPKSYRVIDAYRVPPSVAT